MPLTPFHMGFAWPVWLLKKHRLHFICLSFGAASPDLEVIPLAFFAEDINHARGFMHSIYGALTVDILITLLVAYWLVPPLGRWLRRKSRKGWPKWYRFAGKDISLPPVTPAWAVLSALIGTFSHVFLDLFTHRYNPIFWPWHLDKEIHYMIFPNNTGLSILIFYIPLGIGLIYYLVKYWTK